MKAGTTGGSEDVVVPLRGSLATMPPITHVRSTLIASSLLSLRERGHINAYLQRLPREHHDAVLHSVAGVWLPMGIAIAHYEAADALGLSQQEQHEIGLDVGARIQSTVVGTLARMATGAGITPWTLLGQYQRLCDRLLRGGSAAVFRTGPKEARVEVHGLTLAKIRYFRNGFRGVATAAGQLFCSKMYVSDVAKLMTPTTIVFRFAWA
jgi:hypothetical protein